MRKKSLKLTIGLIAAAFAIGIAGVSCKKENPAQKQMQNVSPEQSKIAETTIQAVEVSKRTTVAKVNGKNISMFDLLAEMTAVAPQYAKPSQKKDPQTDDKIRKAALDRLIYRELAVQEAERQGVKVPQDRVEEELKKVKGDPKSEDAFRERLRRLGITEEEFRKQVERNLLVEMITEKEIFGKVKIDPQQVKKAYAKEKSSYKGPAGQMSFEEAAPLIEQKLMTAAVQKREDQWTEGLKKAAKIEVTLGESAKSIRRVQ